MYRVTSNQILCIWISQVFFVILAYLFIILGGRLGIAQATLLPLCNVLFTEYILIDWLIAMWCNGIKVSVRSASAFLYLNYVQ